MEVNVTIDIRERGRAIALRYLVGEETEPNHLEDASAFIETLLADGRLLLTKDVEELGRLSRADMVHVFDEFKREVM